MNETWKQFKKQFKSIAEEETWIEELKLKAVKCGVLPKPARYVCIRQTVQDISDKWIKMLLARVEKKIHLKTSILFISSELYPVIGLSSKFTLNTDKEDIKGTFLAGTLDDLSVAVCPFIENNKIYIGDITLEGNFIFDTVISFEIDSVADEEMAEEIGEDIRRKTLAELKDNIDSMVSELDTKVYLINKHICVDERYSTSIPEHVKSDEVSLDDFLKYTLSDISDIVCNLENNSFRYITGTGFLSDSPQEEIVSEVDKYLTFIEDACIKLRDMLGTIFNKIAEFGVEPYHIEIPKSCSVEESLLRISDRLAGMIARANDLLRVFGESL